mmetsp:Transcript_14713/g.29797  ORF Transcript_14713/g.29797 Transcript_14713/m.29797 type:complete len:413 (-) Transcript_14713:458-1696(-)|eukprot:CAMPEP_0167781840 /NCGR_PEP_ID=MMETSP0111_2-20121227/6169_1 /TAXON_ID=91324 /ORGANISM="Lotharella globosa, Strain CCCM811" /LENGTH=412 /DNA_ID=CAMNT_0007672573 /DNA_START=1188 /DNA_END=2426 /DNA_ORIENTATION=-
MEIGVELVNILRNYSEPKGKFDWLATPAKISIHRNKKSLSQRSLENNSGAASLYPVRMTSHVAPNTNAHWNQQKVLETVRGLKQLSQQERMVLEQMLQRENTKIASVIQASATVKELELSLVALAKQFAANSANRNEETKQEAGEAEVTRREIGSALEKYSENKVSVQTSSLKAILKILQKVEKKPNDIRTRRLQLNNIVVKKFITTVKGGSELISACGYITMEIGEKKTKYLVLKDVKVEIVRLAISLIQGKISDLKSGGSKAAAPRPTKVLCGCGFWGSSDTDGLCSQCYKKKMFGVPDKSADSKAKKKESSNAWKLSLKKARVKLSALYRFRLGVKTESRIIQKNKKRCFECNKKVGYLGFECRCMYVFCDLHRFPDTHKCTFDYKRQHQNKLKKDNKVVAHEKLAKLE